LAEASINRVEWGCEPLSTPKELIVPERSSVRPTDGTQPSPLSTAEVGIHVLRAEAKIHVPDHVAIWKSTTDSPRPARLRLKVYGDLFCDEMLLVYGRPLCWTGSSGGSGEPLRFVERVFDQIFSLSSDRSEIVTPAPSVVFPEGHARVAWSYGAVLVRGDDPPWAASGLVHIHHEP
jgi:hypothetical protein